MGKIKISLSKGKLVVLAIITLALTHAIITFSTSAWNVDKATVNEVIALITSTIIGVFILIILIIQLIEYIQYHWD